MFVTSGREDRAASAYARSPFVPPLLTYQTTGLTYAYTRVLLLLEQMNNSVIRRYAFS